MNINTQSVYAYRQNWYSAGKSKQDTQTAFTVTAPAGGIQDNGEGSSNTQATSLLAKPLFKHHHGNIITLDDLKANAQDAKAEFLANFKEALSDAGIDESTPIVLQQNSQGIVYVANDNPNKAAIEKIFQDNPGLTSQFQHAGATASVAAAGERANAFQQAYAINPKAAIAQYSYLFDKQEDYIFSLKV